MAKCKPLQFFLTVAGIVLINLSSVIGADKTPAAPKWQRFEVVLKSSVTYTNALQEAEVRALFVSPLGETNRVYGFWDGGKTWRIRYQPNFPGRWTYYTMCSDTANKGLHDQVGEFLCTATKGESRFDLHGPVLVARDQQHLEHADRTPFLWLGDAAWNAAIKSTTADWSEYAQTRAKQKFNVVQWRLSGSAGKKTTAFSGQDQISVNLDFFRQLDAKIASANQAGLLNAIAPLWEIGDSTEPPLPQDQAILLFRYAVARWDAEDVAWIVAFESDSTGAQAARWQNIGRAVFTHVTHAPVILLPGESIWTLDAFRRERWVDVLGVQTSSVKNENSLPWLLKGPLALERQKLPSRPLISIAPPPETTSTASTGQTTADFLRKQMWWNLLLNTPAGVSYEAHDVAEWITVPKTTTMQPWREALALLGAGSIAPISISMEGKDFWQLEPFPQILAAQPGLQSPLQHIAAVSTESRDLIIVHVPEERVVNIVPQAIPARSKAIWVDPRTGTTRPATGSSINATTHRFTTPSNGDWLLVLSKSR